MPVAICQLDSGESIKCESGAMSWMSDNMDMQTQGGGAKKMLGRMFSGDSIFQNIYTARGGDGMIAFASKFPGEIRAIDITPDHPIVVQKGGFLAAEPGMDLSIFFQKKGMAGFFGGEGFIMQKLSGHGTAFIELDGSIVEYDLADGEKLVIDTGYVAMMDATRKMDVLKVLKTYFLGEKVFSILLLQDQVKCYYRLCQFLIS